MKNRILKSGFFQLLAFFCFFGFNVNAQNEPVNYVGWYTYAGYHTVNDANRLAVILEGTIQRNNIIIDPMQYGYRVGLSYEFKNRGRAAFGYRFEYNIPYDAASANYNAINRRIWEQYTFKILFKKLNYRIMMEQIWTQQKAPPSYSTTSDWKFQNVLRFKAGYLLPINNKLTANFYDEVFFNTTELNGQKMFNQNRVYAGLLFNLDKEHVYKMSAGYMFQAVWNTQDAQENRKRINNVLRVSFISDLSFAKKKN